MENKLNIAEILKDCPSGMELDCTMFENLEFDHIDKDNKLYPIRCRVKTEWGIYNFYTFTEYGCYGLEKYSKCVIFPKGKSTWEGFHRPFEDGDIITDDSGNIAIYKGEMRFNNKLTDYYCGYRNADGKFLVKKDIEGNFGHIEEKHLATEEEKQKLFNVIKANGYKWNAETKTLEKLVEPKFKVGDRVKYRSGEIVYRIVQITEDSYVFDNLSSIPISIEHMYNLVPNKFDITTLKPFESRVLVRNHNHHYWRISFFGFFDKNKCVYDTIRGIYSQCIPYEGNEHLCGTTNDCDNFYKTWE